MLCRMISIILELAHAPRHPTWIKIDDQNPSVRQRRKTLNNAPTDTGAKCVTSSVVWLGLQRARAPNITTGAPLLQKRVQDRPGLTEFERDNHAHLTKHFQGAFEIYAYLEPKVKGVDNAQLSLRSKGRGCEPRPWGNSRRRTDSDVAEAMTAPRAQKAANRKQQAL